MSADASDQLAWEARFGRYAAVAAVLSAVLFIAGNVYLRVAVGAQARRLDQRLAATQSQQADFLVATGLIALAFLLLAAVLVYLYRATKYRRAELPTAALVLAIFGGLLAAAAAIAGQIKSLDIAGDFLASGPRTPERARDMIANSSTLKVISGLGWAANLSLGFAMVVISLNAMRAGLLSRFLGILGIIIAVLLVVPLVGASPVLLFFWLLALAALFVNRAPGGRGRAWEAGEAVPWPSMAERAAEIDRRKAQADVAREGGDGSDGMENGAGSGLAPRREEDRGVAVAGDASHAADGGGNGSDPDAGRAKRKRGRSS